MKIKPATYLSILTLLIGIAVLPAFPQSENYTSGEPVEVTLTTGKSLTGTVESYDDDGLTITLQGGGRVVLPKPLLKSVIKLSKLPDPTPTPTPTTPPIPQVPATPTPTEIPIDMLPEATSLRDLRQIYLQGFKRVRYKGKVLQLMPDGLFYADLDAYDAEMHELHEHLVANKPIYAPTATTDIPNVANWTELRKARKEKQPLIVFRGAIARLMPDDRYYWCEEDYEIVRAEEQVRRIQDAAKDIETRLESEEKKNAHVLPSDAQIPSPTDQTTTRSSASQPSG